MIECYKFPYASDTDHCEEQDTGKGNSLICYGHSCDSIQNYLAARYEMWE